MLARALRNSRSAEGAGAGMRIARVIDTTRNVAVLKELQDFSEGKIDTLVGTQMLAKGLTPQT